MSRLQGMATGKHTFLFVDVVGYTLLAQERGDDAAADVACVLLDEARSTARAFGVEVVKACGDGVLAHAEDAAALLRAGLALRARLARRRAFPQLRGGAHHGSAVTRDGDWFGATVCLASRVAGAAAPGELVCTLDVLAVASDLSGLNVEGRGEHELRHCGDARELFAVSRQARCVGRRVRTARTAVVT